MYIAIPMEYLGAAYIIVEVSKNLGHCLEGPHMTQS